MFRVAGPRSLKAALRDLDSEAPAVRASAAQDLARHADDHRDEVVAALLAALGDPAANVRAAAALALADAKADTAVAELTALLDDAHSEVRQMALTALGELGDERAHAAVRTALSDREAPVRFQAVIAHTRVCRSHDEAVRALLAATADDDPLVVHIALRMGEELGAENEIVDPRLLERARALLEHDSDVVRVAAAVVLGRAGRRDGADVLVAVASRAVVTSEADDEAEAIELCGVLGLEEACPALERRGFAGVLTRDPFAWQARVALAAMGRERAIRWVLSELGAWNRERRTLAVAAAGRARVNAAAPQLLAMRDDPSRADPAAVEEALAALGKR